MNRRQFLGSLVALAATRFLPKPKMVTMSRKWLKVSHYSTFRLYSQELGRAMRDTKDREIAAVLNCAYK